MTSLKLPVWPCTASISFNIPAEHDNTAVEANSSISIFRICLFIPGLIYSGLVFSTIIFLVRFLPVTLALYYIAPPKLKNTVLFLCSMVFYCWGEVKFFPIMLSLIATDLFGNKSFDKILGIIAALNTLGYAVGAPLMNFCYDAFGTYVPFIWVCVGIMVVVTLMYQVVISAAAKERKAILAEQ